MIVTLGLAYLSSQSEDLNPELLYIGTVWIDLALVQLIAHLTAGVSVGEVSL